MTDLLLVGVLIIGTSFGLLGAVVGTAGRDFGLTLLGLVVLCLCLYAGYQIDYDNGLTTDSPGYTGNTIHVSVNVTTLAPTPTPFLDSHGWTCTYLNESDTSAGFVCIPRNAQGAGL